MVSQQMRTYYLEQQLHEQQVEIGRLHRLIQEVEGYEATERQQKQQLHQQQLQQQLLQQ